MEDYYLVDAKQEYTSYLISTLAPSMYTGFKDLFEQSKKILNGHSVFKNFQILLSNVPNWNDHMLTREVVDITKETGCDWLDNLITAVFVSHSKILTSVKIGNYRPKNRKIDLKIPDTNSFIHQCYIQAARDFYKNPILFLDDTKLVKPDEILKNQQIAQSIIKESIMMTIRKLLPFRNILNEYLSLENTNTILIGNTSIGGSVTQNNLPAITLPLSEVPKGRSQSEGLSETYARSSERDLPVPITLPNVEPPKQIESSISSKPLDLSEDKVSNHIDNKTKLETIEEKSLPNLKKWKKASSPKKIMTPIKENDSISTVSSEEPIPIKNIQTLQQDMLSISTVSSDEEKEIKVSGKELNLFDIEEKDTKKNNLDNAEILPKNYISSSSPMVDEDDSLSFSEFHNKSRPSHLHTNDLLDKQGELLDLESLISKEKSNKKIESLDSASLHNFVKNIKEELDNTAEQSININIDELSFLNQKEKDNLSSIIPKKIEVDQSSILKSKENQLVPYVNHPEPDISLDLEKIKQVLKEDGTIIDQSLVPSNSFALQNITPVLKEREKSVDQSINRSSIKQTNPNNIKKISIKYNPKGPFKSTKKKILKGKTTLVDEAADEDSSEMIFK